MGKESADWLILVLSEKANCLFGGSFDADKRHGEWDERKAMEVKTSE